jgi:pyruvate kinase
MLEKIILAGVEVVRLNMAHASHDWTRMIVRRIRAVSKRINREVAIMMDIKGPEIRTGDVAAPIQLNPGETFDFTVRPGAGVPGASTGAEEVRSVDVNYKDLINDIKVGDIVLVDNGLLRFEVLEKRDNRIHCKVLNKGQLTSRRHINLPGVKVNLPSFTDKDRKDSLVGLEEGIDFIAMSFVREANDIEQLREFLRWHDSRVQIIAKIEDQSAIENLESIVQACDALMVARGDLGIEIPFEELPLVQRRAVQTCRAHGRPVIIATHMLESMISQPMPTRAEITDVANAVFELADAVMLSGETTVGRYPIECINILDKIARRIESEQVATDAPIKPVILGSDKMKVLRSAVVMANELPGSSIVTFTRRGFIAQGLAALCPRTASILAFTPSEQTFRQMRLLRGVESFLMPLSSDPDATIEHAINSLIKEGRVQHGQKLVIATDLLSQNRLFDSVQLRTIK